MKNKTMKKFILHTMTIGMLSLAFSPVALAKPKAKVVNHHNSVNSYLWGLNYNSRDILTSNGESVENYFPTSGTQNSDEFVVIEKQKKSLSTSTADISVMTSNSSKIYPGAILKADNKLLENDPTIVSLKRAPLSISVDLPGMTNGTNKATVKSPSNSNVKSAINNIVDKWHTTYSSRYTSVPAKVEYTETKVTSRDQIKAKLGIDLEKIGVPLNIDFDAIAKGEKQSLVVDFKQIYYNVSIDTPYSPAEFFDTKVSVNDLKRRGLNDKTPPVYVSNVSYGRAMYINIESKNTSFNLEAAFKAFIKGVGINPGVGYQKELEQSTFKAVILGGDSGEVTKVVNGNLNDLKDIIQKGAKFNTDNPATAISYKTNFLKDNSPAVLNNNSEYVETKITSFKNGELELKHTGAYIAKFYVNWDELSYDSKGNAIYTPKSWEFNGQPRTAGFSTKIPLKGNVRNLKVKITEKTGLVWEPWRTVYEKYNLPLVKNRTVSIWGTTLNPKSNEVIKNS